jgi:hypothetical protein
METEQATTSRELNDAFRSRGGVVTIIPRVQELDDLSGLLGTVREYDEFSSDNDPYHEHDFGTTLWSRLKVFWKIDYYNPSLAGWCDPESLECRRVLDHYACPRVLVYGPGSFSELPSFLISCVNKQEL